MATIYFTKVNKHSKRSDQFNYTKIPIKHNFELSLHECASGRTNKSIYKTKSFNFDTSC